MLIEFITVYLMTNLDPSLKPTIVKVAAIETMIENRNGNCKIYLSSGSHIVVTDSCDAIGDKIQGKIK